MQKSIYTPAFDQTLDREEVHNFDAKICDFGKFANTKVCRVKKNEEPTPVATVGYVATGYVAAGYFVTHAA